MKPDEAKENQHFMPLWRGKEIRMDFTLVKDNLEKRGFQVSCFDTAKDALFYLDAAIDQKEVGIGGSVTIQEMGLYEKLATHNKVYWPWKPIEGKTDQEMRELAHRAGIYFSSVNGLAETGEVINIDGTCNRISATLYGPRKVYLVVGMNKIAPDYEQALYRARNVAAPLNCKRLNRKTPCAIKGDKCYDCNSPERICRGLTVFWRKPGGCDYEIVLIKENLGY